MSIDQIIDYDRISTRRDTLNQLSFLIINDDIDLLGILFDTLTLRGHRVAMAKDSKQALSLAQRISFDIVLAEIIMTDEDCLDNYLKIKRSYPNTEVIITTGYSSDFSEVIGAKEEDLTVIHKPYRIKDMLKRIC